MASGIYYTREPGAFCWLDTKKAKQKDRGSTLEETWPDHHANGSYMVITKLPLGRDILQNKKRRNPIF